MYLVTLGKQLPAAGVMSVPRSAMKMFVTFISETKPSGSSDTASAVPATFA